MRERLTQLVDREVPPDEARAYLAEPVTAEERESVLALVQWFTTRYPTPTLRLAYVRRAYARWSRTVGRGADPSEAVTGKDYSSL